MYLILSKSVNYFFGQQIFFKKNLPKISKGRMRTIKFRPDLLQNRTKSEIYKGKLSAGVNHAQIGEI